MNIAGMNNTNPNFKGLWSPQKYVNANFSYTKEADCVYYEKVYHPFADETRDEISKALDKMDKEINTPDPYAVCSGSYTTLKVGKPVAMTKAVYNDIITGNIKNKSIYNDLLAGRMNRDIPLLDKKA